MNPNDLAIGSFDETPLNKAIAKLAKMTRAFCKDEDILEALAAVEQECNTMLSDALIVDLPAGMSIDLSEAYAALVPLLRKPSIISVSQLPPVPEELESIDPADPTSVMSRWVLMSYDHLPCPKCGSQELRCERLHAGAIVIKCSWCAGTSVVVTPKGRHTTVKEDWNAEVMRLRAEHPVQAEKQDQVYLGIDDERTRRISGSYLNGPLLYACPRCACMSIMVTTGCPTDGNTQAMLLCASCSTFGTRAYETEPSDEQALTAWNDAVKKYHNERGNPMPAQPDEELDR